MLTIYQVVSEYSVSV